VDSAQKQIAEAVNKVGGQAAAAPVNAIVDAAVKQIEQVKTSALDAVKQVTNNLPLPSLPLPLKIGLRVGESAQKVQ